jgi:antitoxin MazE
LNVASLSVYVFALQRGATMIVSKLGDSLIVQLPDDVVSAMGLKEGDAVIVEPVRRRPPTAKTQAERDAALERLRGLRGTLPADFKFDREEANER